ncbi:MAG: hypothetical protein RIR91_1975 [Verrucomicrobiota bacterium]|jgi:hypothetical protein
MNPLAKGHEHYGYTLLALVAAVIVLAVVKGPNTKFQRIVAVLVDINLVVGLCALLQSSARPISWLHPIFALAAVGLMHAGAKSEDRTKVVRCFSIALGFLVLTWSVNASWGPFKNEKTGLPVWPIKSVEAPAATPPVAAPAAK